MQPENVQTCGKKRAFGPYSDLVKFIPQYHKLLLWQTIVYLDQNIGPSEWCFAFGISSKNSVCVSALDADQFTLYLNFIQYIYIYITNFPIQLAIDFSCFRLLRDFRLSSCLMKIKFYRYVTPCILVKPSTSCHIPDDWNVVPVRVSPTSSWRSDFKGTPE